MREININNTEIKPGEHQVVKMFIGKLPSGNKIYIYAHVYRSEKPGPTVLLLGGMHGDEFDGIEILRQFNRGFDHKSLERGTIIVIPVLNIYGFLNFSRDVPDGKDVNRSFPGLSSGSLASRVANSLTKKILPFVDIVIDIHTGGANRYNYPQIRLTKGDEQAVELSKAFNAHFTITKPAISKSLRKILKTQNKPILVYEGGEALRRDELAIFMGLRGIKRILNYLEMLSFEDTIDYPHVELAGSGWRRAVQSGFFIPFKTSGDRVKKGEVIGTIQDLYDNKDYDIKSLRDGFIIGHSNAPVVHQGDALIHIGYF